MRRFKIKGKKDFLSRTYFTLTEITVFIPFIFYSKTIIDNYWGDSALDNAVDTISRICNKGEKIKVNINYKEKKGE